jgi:cell division protein FtsI (penicillin-binding protein 3)
MTVAYGHGIAVTPLHLATGYAMLANGGRLVSPSLVERDAPAPAAPVISETTAAQVRNMLRQVVTRGTAKFAEVEGYEVAGKTGTADKPNAAGGYSRDKVISTFAAIFPASDPEYVLVVGLDEPVNRVNDTVVRTAGWTAAPVAARAIRRITPVLGMRPLPPPASDEPLLYTLAGNE